jgi:hypothetical protein
MTYEVTRKSKDVKERLNKKYDMTDDQIGLLFFCEEIAAGLRTKRGKAK